MSSGMKTVDPNGLNKGLSSEPPVDYRDQYMPEEGWMITNWTTVQI